MSQRHPQPHAILDCHPKRDSELCKVVFGAAISQILYARHAFPPECFQLLPLGQLVSRSFEDIIASGSDIQVYDKEHLRDQGRALFLRQGTNYGVNRFLGILREDIFPLIETEDLVKFRINYLRTETWSKSCLVEYYTVAFKYEHNGSYALDIWRAGMGQHHIARSDAHLWNLGDYLSRLRFCAAPLHWTLAFHATERPDDPPIGVWKFDRTDFDDASLDLQQRNGYTYTRIVRLQIEPLAPTNVEEVIPETSSDAEPDISLCDEAQLELPSAVAITQTQEKRTKRQMPGSMSNSKNQGSRRRGAAAAQLSPPLTNISSRNVSKNAMNKVGEVQVTVRNTDNGVSRGSEALHNPASRNGLVTKRKPKRPLLFEAAASSLPPTQIIGESQSLTQRTNLQQHGQGDGLTGHTMFNDGGPRSPSPDPFKLLDGISLSPEMTTATRSSPYITLPRVQPQVQNNQYQREEVRGLLRLRPSSSVAGAPPGLSQWELQASPAPNLLGITLSDGEDVQENMDTASGVEQKIIPCAQTQQNGEMGMTFDFSPDPLARQTSLFHGLSSSSDGEE